MCWWSIYIGILLTAVGVTAILTPLCRRWAYRSGFLDKPLGEHHKQHSESTPLLGGLAMMLGWLITLFGGLALAHFGVKYLDPELAKQIQGIPNVLSRIATLACGAVFLCIMGIIDDRHQLGPFRKLGCQVVVCGLVALAPELRVSMFAMYPILSWIVTVMWFVFIINAFNFFDNMDGLASGLAVIASCLFGLTAALQQQYYVASLGAVTAGTALGFFIYNRYPATIFMGDAGSHFLGFLLSALATLTIFHRTDSTSTVAAWLIPAFTLALPIFDTFAVIAIRLRAGKPIYYGDHNHISHRFIRMGFSQRTAVLLVHLLALSLGLGAVLLIWLPAAPTIILLVQSLVILLLVSILHHCGTNMTTEQDND